MVAAEPITSLQNSRVKNVVRLGNRRHRQRLQQTVVEGVREISLALQRGVVPVELFICRDYLAPIDEEMLAGPIAHLAENTETTLLEVTPAVFDKMAYRAGSGGLLMVIPYLTRSLADLQLGDRPLIVLIDGAEKPGNLGAILRTADAAGAHALLLTGADQTGTDIHNPNVIRASLGAYFTIPTVTTTRDEALSWFEMHGIKSVATTPVAEDDYTAVSLRGATAIIMGSEALGLDRKWLDSAAQLVRIPMAGEVDSLNLSVATALMIYEAVRQRSSVSVLPGNDA